MINFLTRKSGIGFLFIIFSVLWMVPVMAEAISLQEAKSSGLVGEQANGYLGIVKSSPGVQQLIESVNNARKHHYANIAANNNTSIAIVEKLAAKKAIEMTPAGQYVRLPSGDWVKK
jgi:uncharacterized protein YdbL (DUF1318 family)